MKFLLIASILFSPLTLAHSMAPGFEVERTYSEILVKRYEITNSYNFPAVYKVEVFTKEMQPVGGWISDREVYKLLPNSIKYMKIKFDADEKRKLIVCSTLTEIGKNNEKASIISRVCSRLIIQRLR